MPREIGESGFGAVRAIGGGRLSMAATIVSAEIMMAADASVLNRPFGDARYLWG